MENVISNWSNVQSVPESYVLPPERRPGELVVPLIKTIPVIDLERLGHDRNELIQQIMKASQEYGFFQLTNHDVPEELMHDVLMVAKEFFELPAEDTASFKTVKKGQSPVSKEFFDACSLKASTDYKIRFWRDNFRHPCHPLEDRIQRWPINPARYREVVGRYSLEVRRVSLWLLGLIAEGLGLESGYFEEELSQGQLMTLNHYPACPDPKLVLGLPKHIDPYLITLLNQGDVLGLQVLKDEEWLAVEPLPNAFVVNINHMLQVISNGKLKSVDHRVVTNSNVARRTVVSFIHPRTDRQIEPAKPLVNECNPQLYKAFIFEDFINTYATDTHEGKDPLERYIIRS